MNYATWRQFDWVRQRYPQYVTEDIPNRNLLRMTIRPAYCAYVAFHLVQNYCPNLPTLVINPGHKHRQQTRDTIEVETCAKQVF